MIVQYERDFRRVDGIMLVGVEYRSVTSLQRSAFVAADPRDPVYFGAPEDLTPYLVEDCDSRLQAVFVQQNLSPDDRFISTVGARYDRLDLSIDNPLTGVSDNDNYAGTSARGCQRGGSRRKSRPMPAMRNSWHHLNLGPNPNLAINRRSGLDANPQALTACSTPPSIT